MAPVTIRGLVGMVVPTWLRTARHQARRASAKVAHDVKSLQSSHRLLSGRLDALEGLLLRTASEMILEAAALLRPISSSHEFVRVGGDHDGGYVVARDLAGPDAAMSIGVGQDVSADEELASWGVCVWQFDHTVAESPATSDRITFTRIGVGVERSAELAPIEHLLTMMDTDPEDSVWLLLDAEGVEWDVLTFSRPTIERFDQIVIEFHLLRLLSEPMRGEVMLQALRALAATHVPVAWHPNNFAPVQIIGGHFVPDVLEVTFVAKRCFRPGIGLPATSLYAPNDPHGPRVPEPFAPVALSPYGPTPRCLT